MNAHKIKTITPSEFFRLFQEGGGLRMIDVRELDEIAAVATPMAEVAPLSEFDAVEVAKKSGLNEPLYFLCRSGRRSERAALMVAELGYTNVFNVEGGILAWQSEGLPVKHG